MRKVILCFSIMGLLLGGIVQKARAQDKKLEFNLNIGALTEIQFLDVLYTLGAGLDYRLGEHIMISPELQLWKAPDIILSSVGAILNLRQENFFVGGGLLFQFPVLGDQLLDMSYLMPKINAGFRISKIKFTFYLISGHGLFELVWFGGSIGIVYK